MYISKRALKAILKLCFFIGMTSSCPLALAINPGSESPIEIESDSATFDDKKGTSTYTGNVIITQGLSRLEADSVTVSAVDRKIMSIQATGHPAHFVQQESSQATATHGYGDTILYIAADAILKLSNNASLVQQDNSFSGELIEYDIVQRAIKAKGDETIGTRVKIQYYPHSSEDQQTGTVITPEETTTSTAPSPESQPSASQPPVSQQPPSSQQSSTSLQPEIQ